MSSDGCDKLRPGCTVYAYPTVVHAYPTVMLDRTTRCAFAMVKYAGLCCQNDA